MIHYFLWSTSCLFSLYYNSISSWPGKSTCWMQMKAILLAYLKTVRSSNNCPGNNGRGLCVLLQCDRVGFRNMQPRLAEAAEMLGAKAESTEQYGGAALMLLLLRLLIRSGDKSLSGPWKEAQRDYGRRESPGSILVVSALRPIAWNIKLSKTYVH